VACKQMMSTEWCESLCCRWRVRNLKACCL